MTTTPPPTGTVTVVLGDVVGSSALWERDADGMAEAVKRLGAIRQELADRHLGHLPTEQGEGDNLVAVFPEAGNAARFALDLAAAVRAEAWPSDIDLQLRLAIDTGDVTHDPELGYQGGVFNRASRLRDLVDETRVLISSTVRGLIVDTLDDRAAIDDRGPRHLRGHDRSEHVHELRPLDVEPASRPLPADSTTTIPLETNEMIGRDDEVDRILKALESQRLVTLTGAGGAGKTRLAQHVGHRLADTQRDGVWWTDLSPVADAARVATVIAEASGLDEAGGAGAAMMLVAGLAERQGLLILDNCEHVLDAVAEIVGPIVAHCPGVTVLATSRELLDIDGEQAVRIRPLGLPDTDDITADELQRHPATRLFCERAAATGSFSPSDEDAGTVVRICRRLDGMPLAIELAATRARVLSLDRLADGLDDRFSLLVGRRGASSRQRTLEASISWSYDLLPTAEQEALNRLSVFPGPFDLDGATAVIGADGTVGPQASVHLIGSLVDKSLVSVRDGFSERRYRLLDSIRHFAADRLRESGTEATVRDAHLDRCLALAREDMQGLHSARLAAMAGSAELRLELDDVRAAEAHAKAHGRLDDIVDLHLAYFSTHIVNSTYSESRRVLRALLDEEGLRERSRIVAGALVATYMASGGRPVEAAERSADLVTAARPLNDDLVLLLALLADSHARTWSGAGGLDVPQQAWDLAMSHADDWGDGTTAFAGFLAGVSISHLGGGREGLDILERAVEAALRVDDHGLAATAAQYAAAEGFRLPLPVEEAKALVERVFALAPASLPRLRSLAYSVAGTYGPSLWGDIPLARHNLDLGGALAGPIGSGTHAVHAAGEGLATLLEGDLDGALEQGKFVSGLFAQTSHRWWQMFVVDGVAWTHCARGEWDEARALIEEAWGQLPEPPTWPMIRSRIGGVRAIVLGHDDPELGLGVALDHLAWCWSSTHRTVMPELMSMAAASCMARLGRMEDAARALAIAEGVRGDWTGLLQWYPDFDATLVETALGRERFDELYAEAAAMTPDEGVAWLLRGRGSNTRSSFGWDALTPTERAVAQKAAEGLSNQQIADALFVSPNTVKTHVKSIYTKLRINSRAALSTEVAANHEHGTTDPGANRT